MTGAHDAVLDYADFSLLLFMTIILRISIQDGMKFLLSVSKIPSDDILESPVQNENTRVCATQNCIRIVRHGDSSEDIDAQLSEVEDDGEEEYKSETQTAKL